MLAYMVNFLFTSFLLFSYLVSFPPEASAGLAAPPPSDDGDGVSLAAATAMAADIGTPAGETLHRFDRVLF